MFLSRLIIMISGIIFLLLSSCANLGTGVSSSPTSPDLQSPSTDSPTLLVEDQRDPFEINNIRAVVDSLSGNKLSKSSLEAIQPNYYYVKFTATDSLLRYKLMLWDTSLVLQEFPLDKKILKHGRNTTLPPGVRVFYVAIPVGYVSCPGIQCDTLKELFLPNPVDKSTALAKTRLNSTEQLLSSLGISPTELEYTTLKMSGDTRVEGSDPKQGLAKTAVYTPSGTLKYNDNSLNKAFPCFNARVTYGYWYSWQWKRLNQYGYFVSSSGWSYGVDYHLHWDDWDFEFKNYQTMEGPVGVKYAWNKTFTDYDGVLGVIYDACVKWWILDMGSLGRPHKGTYVLGINIYNRQGDGIEGQTQVNAYGHFIDIYMRTATTAPVNRYKYAYEAYMTTMHEVAHSSYLCNFLTRDWTTPRYLEWFRIANNVDESYSTGIAWYFARLRYPSVNIPMSNYIFQDFTGIIPDLIDDNIKFLECSWGSDYIPGYDLWSIGQAFYCSFTWSELKSNMWNYRPAQSIFCHGQLNYLFDAWENNESWTRWSSTHPMFPDYMY